MVAELVARVQLQVEEVVVQGQRNGDIRADMHPKFLLTALNVLNRMLNSMLLPDTESPDARQNSM